MLRLPSSAKTCNVDPSGATDSIVTQIFSWLPTKTERLLARHLFSLKRGYGGGGGGNEGGGGGGSGGGVDIATKCSDTSFSAILASASLHVWQKSLHNTGESKIRAKHSAHVSSSQG